MGFRLSTISMNFTVTEKKQSKMQIMPGKFLHQTKQEKGMISAECLNSFCGRLCP